MEIMPPTVVNAASGFGTGQLPDKEGQMYHCEVDDLYLIPTAEVPVTNIYRDVIIDEKQLPIKNCAYTQCFRLIVFKQCSNDTRQSQSTSVQCMAQLCLFVLITITAFQTVSLIIIEIGYGTYFQPTFLSFRIYFEVEAKSGSETVM